MGSSANDTLPAEMEARLAGGRKVAALASATHYVRNPKLRIGVAVAAFAAVTFVTYLIAHPRMFTGFAPYDDEGYMLIALKSFLKHGNLYNKVFTQYGPFYYEAWGAVFSILGIPLTHDGGRTVTLCVWVMSSLIIGLATWRITESMLLGLASQMLVFATIVSLTNEPMHPGGILIFLLAVIVAISSFVRSRVSCGAMGLLGGAVMALVLVKINVGGFALASVALACVVSYSALAGRRWLRLVVEAGFVATPIVLMLSKLGEGWARHYAFHVAIAALAVVIVLRSRTNGRRSPEELWWLGGGLLVMGVTVCLAIIATGTTLGGLVDGVLRQPLRQSDAFSIAFQLTRRTYELDLIALAGAVAYWYVARGRRTQPGKLWVVAMSMLSIGIGVEMALSPIGKTFPFESSTLAGYPLLMLAFAWVALIPAPGGSKDTAFARLLLPPLAVLQALHAYPVAGSQIQWSAFLLVPVGMIAVSNGVRGLAHSISEEHERRGLAVAGASVAIVLGFFLVDTTLRQPLQEDRAAYNAAQPLDLPGATSVRLSTSAEVSLYRGIVTAINANCRSFLMLPGMNSFYLWTEQEPPTGYNATGWPTLFDNSHQQRVIAETKSIRGLCLLENVPLAQSWSGGTIPNVPLVRYLHHGFRPIATFGDYKLLRREGAGSSL